MELQILTNCGIMLILYISTYFSGIKNDNIWIICSTYGINKVIFIRKNNQAKTQKAAT